MKEDEDCRNVSNKFNWVALAQQSHLATDWSRIARSGTVVLKEASARFQAYFRREGGHYTLL